MNNLNLNTRGLTFDQCVDLAVAVGPTRSILFRGEMGIGKSSMGPALESRLPGHDFIYIDGTTMVDSADMFMVDIYTNEDGQRKFHHITHEDLGFGSDQPVILMFDEIGKMHRSAQLACLRAIHERKYGRLSLPEGSIVIATTNLAMEGVGDLLPAHARNRMCIIDMLKPDAKQWIENFAIGAGVHPTILSYVKDNPDVFHSFTAYENPDENQHIFHPRSTRDSFVTHRSMHMASDILWARDGMDDTTLNEALAGVVGRYTADHMAAYIALGDQMPKLDEIHSDPENARIPDSPAAVCMVVYRELAVIKREHVSAWMTYLQRLSKETQGLFVNGVRALKGNNPQVKERFSAVNQNGDYQKWCLANNYMFDTRGN